MVWLNESLSENRAGSVKKREEGLAWKDYKAHFIVHSWKKHYFINQSFVSPFLFQARRLQRKVKAGANTSKQLKWRHLHQTIIIYEVAKRMTSQLGVRMCIIRRSFRNSYIAFCFLGKGHYPLVYVCSSVFRNTFIVVAREKRITGKQKLRFFCTLHNKAVDPSCKGWIHLSQLCCFEKGNSVDLFCFQFCLIFKYVRIERNKVLLTLDDRSLFGASVV